MALNPKYMGITRNDVRTWVLAWRAMDPTTRPTLRAYITTQVNAMNLPDPIVDVSQRDDYPLDTIHIVQNIMDDVRSYA